MLLLSATCYASEELPLMLQTRDMLIEMPGRGFTARVVFDGKTRLPSRLIYWGADRAVLTAPHSSITRRPAA